VAVAASLAEHQMASNVWQMCSKKQGRQGLAVRQGSRGPQGGSEGHQQHCDMLTNAMLLHCLSCLDATPGVPFGNVQCEET